MAVLDAALVGTGFIGQVHAEAIRRLGRPMYGVLGSSPEKTQAFANALNIFRAYESFEELLEDPVIKVVHLTSPNWLHYDECRKAIEAGKHVICEKPLAVSDQQTGHLIELTRAAPVVTAVGYNVRYYPLCQEARARIAEGQLGPIYHVTGSYLQDWLLHETDFNWRVVPEEGGELRAVADIGTHWLDLVTWMTGLRPQSLCADLRTFLPVRQRPLGSVRTFQTADTAHAQTEQVAVTTEDYGAILIRFHGGASGSLVVSQVAAGRKNCLRLEIAGGRNALAWDSERPNELHIGHRDRANELLLRDPSLLTPAARPFCNYPGGHNEGFPDTFKQLFRSIYDYIEAGEWQAPRPFPGFLDGHREAVFCTAILTSHREQRWVDVPELD